MVELADDFLDGQGERFNIDIAGRAHGECFPNGFAIPQRTATKSR
jgi:hypothetical protein